MSLVKAIGAQVRAVAEREYEGKPARVVIAERVYDTHPDDLWDALTSAERIPRWFLPISGDLKLGGRYQLQGNAGGSITRCDPPAALDVTWEFAGGVSWVTVRLSAEGEATRLVLEHIAPIDAAADPHWLQFGPGAVGVGWDLTLLGLGEYVDSGAADAARAWSETEPAKAFMRASATAWAEAHIAAGEDPETARAMAARTASFYAPE